MSSFATIRHDLRNHLTVILGFTELLLTDTPASDPRHADLETIREAATAALDALKRPAAHTPVDDEPPKSSGRS